MQLRKYRNDERVAEYHYALGERYIDVDGIQICYQEMGQGDPVLVLPGLGTSIDFWQLTLPDLARRNHVIAVDPPGGGKSSKPDASYDLMWLVERLCTFLDRLHIERVSIVGGSMGGHLGLLMALEHPSRVDRLVLMGSAGAWPQPGPLLGLGLKLFFTDAIVADHVRRTWPQTYSKILLHPTPLTQELFADQMAIMADSARYAPEGRAFARTLRSSLHTPCRDRFSELRLPVLIIWGEKDRIQPVRTALAFRQRIPDSRLVIIRDSGHEVMIDQTVEFNRLVATFLQSGTAGVEDDFGPLRPKDSR